MSVDTTVDGEILTGVGSMILKTNQPPYNGSCIAYNNTGEPLSTNFTIICSKWLDDDGYITQYEYWCKYMNIYNKISFKISDKKFVLFKLRIWAVLIQ